MTFVLFSTADWLAPYWTNKQHIAKGLAERGHRVLYIESPGIRPPRGNARDIKRLIARLGRGFSPPTERGGNLWVYSPLTVPLGHRFAIVRTLNGWLLRWAVQNWCSQYSMGDIVVWTYHPYISGIIEAIPAAALVYHCVDDLAAIPGVDATIFRIMEDNLLARADLVFTTSPYLQDHCARIAGPRAIYERNVADIEHFAEARQSGAIPDDLGRINGPKLCYIGVLSDYKLDLDFIEKCIQLSPDWNWIFIGEEPERQSNPIIARLAERSNVHFLGYKTYDVLPDYLRGIDVALLPNLTSGYMSGVFPMKLYEYLAAGKPVVATRMAALSALAEQISIIDTPQEMVEAVTTILASPPEPIALGHPDLANFSWNARLDRMMQRLVPIIDA